MNTTAHLIADRPAIELESDWQMPVPRRLTLANGIEVHAFDMPGKRLASVLVNVGYGAILDPAGKEGLAAATTAALFSGIRGGSAADLAEQLDAAGAAAQAMADVNGAIFVGSAPLDRLGVVADVLAAARAEPTLADAEIELAISQLAHNARMMASYGPGVADLAARGALYPASARNALPVEGTAASTAALTGADVRAFYEREVATAPAAIYVCGDLGETDVAGLLRPFEAWRVPGPFVPLDDGRAGAVPARITIVDMPAEPQTQVVVAAPAAAQSHPAWADALTATQLLGGGTESLLWHRLREDKGWTYGVNAALNGGTDRSELIIHSIVANEAAADAAREILAVWDEMVASPLAGDKHRAAAAELAGALQSDVQRPVDLVSHAAYAARFALPYDVLARQIRAVTATTAASVPAGFAGVVDRAAARIVLVGPAAGLPDALSDLGLPVEVTRPDEQENENV